MKKEGGERKPGGYPYTSEEDSDMDRELDCEY